MAQELNIPIYRAKKIDSDEYVEGDFFKGKPSTNTFNIDYWFEDEVKHGKKAFTIDVSTLAIHFPDMIDSDGTKIFASLSEDGKGGDIIDDLTEKMVVRYDSVYRSIIVSEEMMFYELNFARVKVTGIQE